MCRPTVLACQQEEAKRCYRRFVTVLIGITIIALLLVLFGKVSVFMLVFVLHVIVLHVIILCCGVLHELSSVWRLYIISKFCKGSVLMLVTLLENVWR